MANLSVVLHHNVNIKAPLAWDKWIIYMFLYIYDIWNINSNNKNISWNYFNFIHFWQTDDYQTPAFLFKKEHFEFYLPNNKKNKFL